MRDATKIAIGFTITSIIVFSMVVGPLKSETDVSSIYAAGTSKFGGNYFKKGNIYTLVAEQRAQATGNVEGKLTINSSETTKVYFYNLSLHFEGQKTIFIDNFKVLKSAEYFITLEILVYNLSTASTILIVFKLPQLLKLTNISALEFLAFGTASGLIGLLIFGIIILQFGLKHYSLRKTYSKVKKSKNVVYETFKCPYCEYKTTNVEQCDYCGKIIKPCPKCDQILKKDDVYCYSCGKRLFEYE